MENGIQKLEQPGVFRCYSRDGPFQTDGLGAYGDGTPSVDSFDVTISSVAGIWVVRPI